MGRKLKRLCLIAALALPFAARADTQVKPHLSLSAEERYDDDLLLQQEANAGGELLSKISPKVGVELDDHTWKLDTWYAADLGFHHGSGSVSLDHRAELSFRKATSEQFQYDGDLQLWRVSDPTSLPRLGLAKTLSPVLYLTGDFGGTWWFAPRWSAKIGARAQAAKVYTPGTSAGYMEAPFIKTMYRLTRRADGGIEYRAEFFQFNGQTALSHGLFADYDYKLSRELTFTASAGPVFYREPSRPDHSGVVPRVHLQLEEVAPRVAWALILGHDLVGASGFTAAIWADYASLVGSWRVSEPLKLIGAANFYRNGEAPNVGLFSQGLSGGAVGSGYGFEVGLDWTFSRQLALRGTIDRFGQVGAQVPGAPDLTRDVFALRAIVTAW